MIASVEGTVAAVGENQLIVTVGGVGLRIHVPDQVLQRVGGPGAPVRLFTHLHVRENELALYGCTTQEELDLFQLLVGVSGIGPRSALMILSFLSPERIQAAIVGEQADVLAQVQGVGPKTARRIIFQLKDKMTVEALEMAPHLTDQDADVIAALTALGYSVVEAQMALQGLPSDPELTVEELIRLALASFA